MHCFEKSPRTGGPPGVSLLINHNAMATLEDYDPPLHARLAAVGSPVLEWAARSTTGEVLYAQDMVAGGLADSPGLVARWDHFVAAVREAAEQGEHGIRYSAGKSTRTGTRASGSWSPSSRARARPRRGGRWRRTCSSPPTAASRTSARRWRAASCRRRG